MILIPGEFHFLMNRAFHIPIAVITDSYKAGHHLMYPEADAMIAYGEFRTPYNKDPKDSRFIAYGISYIIEHYISIKWTMEDVEQADKFFSTHNAGMLLAIFIYFLLLIFSFVRY